MIFLGCDRGIMALTVEKLWDLNSSCFIVEESKVVLDQISFIKSVVPPLGGYEIRTMSHQEISTKTQSFRNFGNPPFLVSWCFPTTKTQRHKKVAHSVFIIKIYAVCNFFQTLKVTKFFHKEHKILFVSFGAKSDTSRKICKNF
jgi:hypothetical protein